ncbi:hypothetical protein [Sulfitobacter geojensis]|uniref:hypothetical protein n=1 Tax=Sulfitobacter geojensis TaxID=1342299 RepID=UPI000AB45293|nr:hypothetical protein [Sulfitobacter geojensis]
MTNVNADSANEELRPIQDWENREVDGKGLACKRVYDKHVAEVAELRQRQEAYEASLPKEPLEALSEINHAMKDPREIESPQYAARAALTILQELSMKGGLDNSDQINEAVYWLSCRGLEGLALIEEGTRKAMAIAHQFHPMHEKYQA